MGDHLGIPPVVCFCVFFWPLGNLSIRGVRGAARPKERFGSLHFRYVFVFYSSGTFAHPFPTQRVAEEEGPPGGGSREGCTSNVDTLIAYCPVLEDCGRCSMPNSAEGRPRCKQKRSHAPAAAFDEGDGNHTQENTFSQADDGGEDGPACQSCRRRKSRCSKQQPCAQCERLEVECLYDERRRPGFKTGALDSLSQRLANLEQMFLGQ